MQEHERLAQALKEAWKEPRVFSRYEALVDLSNIIRLLGRVPITEKELASRWHWSRGAVNRFLTKHGYRGKSENNDRSEDRSDFPEENLVVIDMTDPATDPGKPNKRKSKISPPAVIEEEFPAALDTPECRQAWADWLAYKAERRDNYLPRSKKTLLTRLGKYGPDAMCAAIEASISNGWMGLFPERFAHRSNNGPNPVFMSAEERRKEREMDLFVRVSSGKGAVKLLE